MRTTTVITLNMFGFVPARVPRKVQDYSEPIAAAPNAVSGQAPVDSTLVARDDALPGRPVDKRRPHWAQSEKSVEAHQPHQSPTHPQRTHHDTGGCKPESHTSAPASDHALADTERALFGVARWPVVTEPRFLPENNRHYGQSFAREAFHLGQRIGHQNHSFQMVWAHARHWRAEYEIQYGSGNADFGRARDPNITYKTPIMALDRYAYVADRIPRIPGAVSGQVEMPKYVNGRPARGSMPVLEVRYTSSTVADGEVVPLTNLVAWFQADGSQFEPQSGMVPCIGRIRHTRGPQAEALNGLIERHYQNALATDQPLSERLQSMAHLHWLLAHQMPDRRGSAAKAELVVRAVGYATGIELPAFREGIVPDLEAYMKSEEDFVAQYPSMFTRTPRQF